jgi:NAD(P)-dependent dehydrogenase (short-subunit alcohol dehydrogenase family)
MTDLIEQRRVAWITGAGKGIGRALAQRLVADGWTVAASARTEADLDSLAAACPPGTVVPFALDVTNALATARTLDAIVERLGLPDLAVLNAGTHKPMPAETFSAQTLRTLVEVNLMGTANCLEVLIPSFIARKAGHIAVVGSVAGYRGLPTAAAYGATKAGVINMCEALKPELARHGVKLSLINPGFVETPLTDRNDFDMPFLIPAEKAADYIARGLGSDRFETAFPRRFAFIMKLLRILPDRLFFALTKRMVRR